MNPTKRPVILNKPSGDVKDLSVNAMKSIDFDLSGAALHGIRKPHIAPDRSAKTFQCAALQPQAKTALIETLTNPKQITQILKNLRNQ